MGMHLQCHGFDKPGPSTCCSPEPSNVAGTASYWEHTVTTVSGTNTSWGGTLPSAAFSEEMKTERHWTLISLFSVSGEAQRLRVSQLDGIMGQVPGTALGRDAGTLLAWSGHLCAIAPGRAPTGPSRRLTAGQRGCSSQSLALALTPRCSAWDFVCRPIFMAPDVLCGFPSPLNYLSSAPHQLGPQKGVPASSCREGLSHSVHFYHTAPGAHLRAGGWHHAMPAGRATLGPACHTQQVRLSPCVRLWACQRALRVQLCLCNTV